MFELSQEDFKIVVINVLKDLKEKMYIRSE